MLAVVALIALGSTACVVRTRPVYYYEPRPVVVSGSAYVAPAQPAQPAQPAYVPPAQPAPAQPVPVQCVCRQGAVEICNGCDDNCNGVIDEQCVR